MNLRISCINKHPRNDPYRAITHIGGLVHGQSWRSTQQQAINHIESGKYSFYVERPAGDRVKVIVATSKYGNKYIKTTADSDAPNNLLSLPECI